MRLIGNKKTIGRTGKKKYKIRGVDTLGVHRDKHGELGIYRMVSTKVA